MRSWWQDRTLRLRASGAVSGLAVVTFVTNIVVVQIWEHFAPTYPIPSAGNVFAHNDHGSITYFSAFQATSAALMFWAAFIGIALAFIMMPKKDVVVRAASAECLWPHAGKTTMTTALPAHGS